MGTAMQGLGSTAVVYPVRYMHTLHTSHRDTMHATPPPPPPQHATLKSKAGCGSRIVYAFYIHIRLVVCEPRSRRLAKLKISNRK